MRTTRPTPQLIPGATTLTEIVLPGLVEPDGLIIRERAVPPLTEGRALVRMEATGVSFAEQQMRRGRYYDQPPFPFVPGYDLVGIVEAVGGGETAGHAHPLLGRRVAVVSKTGGWATHLIADIRSLVAVPDALDPAEAETLVVNGLTAWQMLDRVAHTPAGATIVVHGANGGVGTVLTQLAVARGARVIGTASPRHHDALREQGVEPLDYTSTTLLDSVRDLAPGGVDAVFDHIGGAGLADSWRMLRRCGVLISYGSAATVTGSGSAMIPILVLVGRLALWNLLPNGRSAHFYNLWAGVRRSDRFWSRVRDDLGRVFALAAEGRVRGSVAARIPLSRTADALRLAESRTVVGKVVIVPDAR